MVQAALLFFFLIRKNINSVVTILIKSSIISYKYVEKFKKNYYIINYIYFVEKKYFKEQSLKKKSTRSRSAECFSIYF